MTANNITVNNITTKNNSNAGVFKIVYPYLKDDGTNFTPKLYKVVVFAKIDMYTYITNKEDGSHPDNWSGATTDYHGEFIIALKQNFASTVNDLAKYSDDRLKHQEVPINNGLYLINQVKTEFYKKQEK